MAAFDHAVTARLDYGFNWGADGWLSSGETIESSTWTITEEASAVLEQPQVVDGITSVFVYLSEVDKIYRLVNRIETSQGRADSRTHFITCKKR